MIGRTLAHYRITAAIGAGGMGEVYRATGTRLGREVAQRQRGSSTTVAAAFWKTTGKAGSCACAACGESARRTR